MAPAMTASASSRLLRYSEMALTAGDLRAIGEVIAEKLDDRLRPIQKSIDEHSETLYGNGHPGLKIDVDRLKESAKRSETSRAWRMALWSGAVLAGLGGIINLAIAFFK